MYASPPFWRRELFSGSCRDLALVTYGVEPALLEPLVPWGTELDVVDGQAFMSLVAMRLLAPRMLGLGLPWGRELAQVSLRFYVREGEHHGLVLVRDDVPHRLVAWGARALFHEPYAHSQVTCIKREEGPRQQLDYLLHAHGRLHHLSVGARGPAHLPAGERAKFFEQRPFGYGRSRRGQTLCYALSHPLWRLFEVEHFSLDWDFGALYGARFAVLNELAPEEVLFAEGSPVSASLPWRHVRATDEQVVT